ncbi:hypothetical protein P171DRAFT_289953 [Karstenula rhodostoma CBS 690.94]|uniref:Uncharacterized protein n=1 Tax=Karstenula rhodostoma CBS 690.94 TaxID=1392251 RepID=A0A9P4UCE1_9PLEO|nr:hypothetical protein P171DRAFT_289953 [Karstenula rhodostoma CBS 690.94]
MLLPKLFLLPAAVASSVTVYMHSVPSTSSPQTAVIPSPIPLVQISYDADQTTGTVISYTPPQGSYASDHLLRIGLHDTKAGTWKGHVGFRTTVKEAGDGDELEVELVRREAGPKPVLNKPVVLNADGRIDSKEPEKTFIQK